MGEQPLNIAPEAPKYPPEYDPTDENSALSRLFKLMDEQKIEKSDAIVWLEGNILDRVYKCVELMEKKYAKDLLVSGGAQKGGDPPIETIKETFLKEGIPENAMIMETASTNTKNQTLNVLQIVKEKKWKKIILVANPYFKFRTFLNFVSELKKQGLEDDLEIVNAPADLSWFRTPSGARKNDEIELLDREEIPRLIKYAEVGDVATPSEGIAYLEKWKNKKAMPAQANIE